MSNNPYRCQSCNHTDDRENMEPAIGLVKRFEVGEPFSDKECPLCAALCFPVSDTLGEDNDPPSILPDPQGDEAQSDYVLNEAAPGCWLRVDEQVLHISRLDSGDPIKEGFKVEIHLINDRGETEFEPHSSLLIQGTTVISSQGTGH